ncbi:indole-3-glycerol phosphate synthase TrpC [Dendrosporobacter sp. 1207_IL3150]|uniref:indole-3-glycerol phosphate synthase TrpC n=1 Tax=Dendrosporobacter sp. 1207_IL3150 TaxID=3084054 RepID=UPI002FDB6FA0
MLDKIVAKKEYEVAETKKQIPLQALRQQIKPGNFALSKALRDNDWGLIAECKLASPAKGQLCEDYTVPELAKTYTEHGALALSVHTDPHFKGIITDIAKVRAVTDLPILRKDFIIDEYQIYEARAAGADAILLIAAILTDYQLRDYLYKAWSVGLDCLVEVHTKEELQRVLKTPAELIGINNRNLQTFKTDIVNTFELLPDCHDDRVVISESGIKSGNDASRLKEAGVRGILVGEGLVKAEDIGQKTRELALNH